MTAQLARYQSRTKKRIPLKILSSSKKIYILTEVVLECANKSLKVQRHRVVLKAAF